MELAASDLKAAKNFYTSLFGWQFVDNDMGPGGVYTIFQVKGSECAASYQIGPDQKGCQPHWMVYIATNDVDASAAKVKELGGSVEMGPFDVGPHGRMAVVKDPAGVYFSLWKGAGTGGIRIANEDNTFCWADLNTPDRDSARKFYGTLFGWLFLPGEGKDESGYLHIQNGDQMIGGMPPREQTNPNAPPHWMLYFLVADVDASTKKASDMGAKVLMPPMTLPGTGEFSILADPQGAVFSLFKAEAKASAA